MHHNNYWKIIYRYYTLELIRNKKSLNIQKDKNYSTNIDFIHTFIDTGTKWPKTLDRFQLNSAFRNTKIRTYNLTAISKMSDHCLIDIFENFWTTVLAHAQRSVSENKLNSVTLLQGVRSQMIYAWMSVSDMWCRESFYNIISIQNWAFVLYIFIYYHYVQFVWLFTAILGFISYNTIKSTIFFLSQYSFKKKVSKNGQEIIRDQ